MKQLMKLEIQPKYVIPAGYKPVYQMPYKDVYLDERNNSLLSVWNHRSELISNEIYRNDCLKILSMVVKYAVKSFISDVTMNRFVIPAELQLWYAREIAPQFEKAGLRKCAVIVENDLRMMGTIEEIANNASKANGAFIPLRFFSTLQDARQWAIR